jgi:single-stranded DNA-specific DHH superfamily exonuclease
LLFNDPTKAIAQIEHMDGLNLRRKEIQEQMLEKAQELLDPDQSVLIVADESFHE